MPLYDVTNKNHSLVRPADAEGYEVLEAVKRKCAKSTFDRMVKTVDDAIEDAVQAGGKLIWTKSAALFGHGSTQPKKHVDHLWEHIIKSVGEDKHALMAVGGMLRWRISERKENWLVYRREDPTGKIDPDTGHVITISEYWINPTYQYKAATVLRRPGLSDLASKWGARLNESRA